MHKAVLGACAPNGPVVPSEKWRKMSHMWRKTAFVLFPTPESIDSRPDKIAPGPAASATVPGRSLRTAREQMPGCLPAICLEVSWRRPTAFELCLPKILDESVAVEFATRGGKPWFRPFGRLAVCESLGQDYERQLHRETVLHHGDACPTPWLALPRFCVPSIH